MKAYEFDKEFGEGKSVLEQVYTTQMHRPDLDHRRIQLALPGWMVNALDHEARRLGVIRQSVIKVWLAERLDQPTE